MSTDRIDTADEFLEHFGVKGMKWGVKRASVDKGPKATSREIKDARKRNKERKQGMRAEQVKFQSSTGKTAEKHAKNFADMQSDFLKSPDRATAARITRGEKAAMFLISPSFTVAGAVVGTRVGYQKSVSNDVKKRQVNSE